MEVNGTKIEIKISDTPGQAAQRTAIKQSLLKGAHIVVIVYSVDEPVTLESTFLN